MKLLNACVLIYGGLSKKILLLIGKMVNRYLNYKIELPTRDLLLMIKHQTGYASIYLNGECVDYGFFIKQDFYYTFVRHFYFIKDKFNY